MARLISLICTLIHAAILIVSVTANEAVCTQLAPGEYRALERAYNLMEKEKYHESLMVLGPMLEKKHPSSYAYSYGSICYANLGESSTAMQLMQKAVEHYPDNHTFRFNLGIFQMQSSDFAGAVTSFSSLIDPVKPQGQLRYNLAFAHYRLQQYKQALSILGPITTGTHVKKHWLRLKIHCHVASGQWKEAETTTRRLLSLAPDAPEIWTLLGQISINLKQYSAASACFEVAQTLSPSNTNLGNLEQLYGFQSAWNEMVRQQRLRGTSPELIARNLYRSCQYRQALDELEKKPVKTTMEAVLLKGQPLFTLGEHSTAVKVLQSVEQLEPGGEKKNLKEKRRERDRITAQARLLAGQILWIDHKWERARNMFKQLELLPGYRQLGASLADCMQTFLDETSRTDPQPGLYDPPLLTQDEDIN